MQVVYIHGASASSASFNYIRDSLKLNGYAIDYSSSVPFYVNLSRIANEIREFDDIFIVGHSLGGIYGIHLYNLLPFQVKGAVTLSTPYGGSLEADMIQLIDPFKPLWKDVGVLSPPIIEAQAIRPQVPWVNVVSTRGRTPLIFQPNDGVVTIQSQMAHPTIQTIPIETTHYEVTQCKESVKIIQQQIQLV